MTEKEITEEEVKTILEELKDLDKKSLEDEKEKAIDNSYIDNGIEYVDYPLTEQDVKERITMLRKYELDSEYNKIAIDEMHAQLEAKLPSRLLQDSINEMRKDIDEGMINRNTKGGNEIREKATEAEIEMMKIKLKSLEREKELDLPTRNLRLQISRFNESREQADAPEKQIAKLRKAIREKKEPVLSTRVRSNKKPTGVL